MKSFLKTGIVLSCLAALISIACNKPEVTPASNSLTPSPVSPTPGVIIGNKELFWEQPWDTAAGGYILNLKTLLLTQSQINRGVDVGIAILGAGDSPWVTIPTSLYDFLPDSVHLSYNVTLGQLQVKAQASFDMIKVKSDVYIEYK